MWSVLILIRRYRNTSKFDIHLSFESSHLEIRVALVILCLCDCDRRRLNVTFFANFYFLLARTQGGIFTTPGDAYTTPVDMWVKGLGEYSFPFHTEPFFSGVHHLLIGNLDLISNFRLALGKATQKPRSHSNPSDRWCCPGVYTVSISF